MLVHAIKHIAFAMVFCDQNLYLDVSELDFKNNCGRIENPIANINFCTGIRKCEQLLNLITLHESTEVSFIEL